MIDRSQFLRLKVLPSAVYLHYPLCRHHCSYCDFNVFGFQKVMSQEKDFEDLYIAAVRRDLQFFAQGIATKSPLKTLYFGGGTPSLLSLRGLRELKRVLSEFYDGVGSGEVEWTIEINPESVDDKTMAEFCEVGINRASLGIQSFADQELRRLERLATRDHIEGALQSAPKYFKNFSVDLMLGIPDQTDASVGENLEVLHRWNPPHLSVYLLTLSDDHKWNHHPGMKSKMVSESLAARLYLWVCQDLKAAGYHHYEVSNFCRPGFESRHNSTYWTGTDSYLGLGPGAHGFLRDGFGAAQRYEIARDWQKWLARTDVSWIENLTPAQQRLEDFYFHLRTRKPISLSSQQSTVQALVKEGLLEGRPDHQILLTDQGWLFLESVASRLVQGVDL